MAFWCRGCWEKWKNKAGPPGERSEAGHRDGDGEGVEAAKSPDVLLAERRRLLDMYNKSVKVQGFGMFGERRWQDGARSPEGEVPTLEMVLTDPAGLDFVDKRPLNQATGLAGEIYHCLNIEEQKGLPSAVKEAVTIELR